MKVKNLLTGMLNDIEIKELLWTNPYPNASFGTQAINDLGLSNYDDYIVVFTYGGEVRQRVGKRVDGLAYGWTASMGTVIIYRSVNSTSDGNGLAFSNAEAGGFGPSTFWGQNNSALVPLYIYGIRKSEGTSYLNHFNDNLSSGANGNVSYGTQWVRIGSVQICWETVNVWVPANGVGTVTWTYPQAFGYTPMVNGSILSTDYPTVFDISPYSKSASATTFKIRSQANTGYTMYADVIAIGHI